MNMLANKRRVSASTHNQALSAILFLYREVLGIDLSWLDGVNRPAQKRRISSVLTKEEVSTLFQFLDHDMRLLAQLLYGTGMRLMEGLRLRIKDVDFDRHVVVREAKGNKDRVVMLPRSLAPRLRQQLGAARSVWEQDRQAQRIGVQTPHALEQKYPKVASTLGWFWLFPSPTLSVDPVSGMERRHHLFLGAVATRHQKGGGAGGHLQAGFGTYIAPQFCHALAAIWHQHPHGSGTAGAQRCVHHHDLHPCAEGGSWRHGQSVGCIGLWRLTGD